MLVKEILEGFKDKSITKQILADMYNINHKQVQRKLKQAGFEWNRKEQIYEYLGTDSTMLQQEIEVILVSPTTRKDNASKSTSDTDSSNATKGKVNTTSNNNSTSELDTIDILLLGKKTNSNRIYRGFYFDNDVIEIIDGIGSGNKSELINQALRKVFKEKGLL